MPGALNVWQKPVTFRLSGRVQSAALFVLMALLYCRIFFVSGESAASPDFESGWQSVLEYAAFFRLPFGKQIFYNFGPLGYLASASGMGLLGPARILFAAAWPLLVCASVLDFSKAASMRKAVFLGVWLFLFHHPHNVYDYEFHPLLVILTLTHALFFRSGDTLRSGALAVVLAIFTCMKVSFFPVSAVILFLYLLYSLMERRGAAGIRFLLLYAASLVLVWALAGQSLSGLFPWLGAGSWFTRGHMEAMGISGDVLVFKLGTAACGVFALFAMEACWRLRKKPAALGLILFTVFAVLMQWRHAFVRADTHLFFLTRFLPAAFLVFGSRDLRPSKQERAYGCFFFSGTLGYHAALPDG